MFSPVLRSARAQEELTAERVRKAIERGVTWIRKQQNTENGSWTELGAYRGGVPALCTLALLNASVPPDDPTVQRSLAYLRTLTKPEMTYCVALQTMVLCLASPDAEGDRLQITKNVRWLERTQITDGEMRGAWGYSAAPGRGDNSNSQFALLALHEADRIGVKVDPRVWLLAKDYWLRTQKRGDGSWGYTPGDVSTGSMTCAGITSLVITMDRLTAGDAKVAGDAVACCGEQEDIEPIERALEWMGNHFSVERNPVASGSPAGVIGSDSLLYYLYGMERVGRLTGRRFFVTRDRAGRSVDHDWYREGATHLVNMQDTFTGNWKGVGHAESEPLIGTSFALLFLAKGLRPVLLAKYKHRDDTDWNLHRTGVHNLTRSVEKAWKTELTWQIIEGRGAFVEDLLQTPVLFISGRETLNLSQQQKHDLRQYVDQGGFIFAEACHGNGCNGEAFDRSFRALMKEIFPDSPLRVLPLDHPVWFAEVKVDPAHLPEKGLMGVDSCCRTSVVYCPENLSCFWELAQQGREMKYPPEVEGKISAMLALGQNVLAYATNRELQDKLRPRVRIGDAATVLTRNSLTVPKLSHAGGSDDAPNALRNMLRLASQQIEMPMDVPPEAKLIRPDDPQLLLHPIVFMHGRREFRFSEEERSALKAHLERGGFLFADSICASQQFTDSFRREMQAIWPDGALEVLPRDHDLLTQEYRGYSLSTVKLRDPLARDPGDPLRARIVEAAPRLEALKVNGRIAVIFSPFDISCAMENHASLECKSYVKEDAVRIAVNVLLYALQQ
jgi:hypothetical protein